MVTFTLEDKINRNPEVNIMIKFHANNLFPYFVMFFNFSLLLLPIIKII